MLGIEHAQLPPMPTPTYAEFFGGPCDGIVINANGPLRAFATVDRAPLPAALYDRTTRAACSLCGTRKTDEPAYQWRPTCPPKAA